MTFQHRVDSGIGAQAIIAEERAEEIVQRFTYGVTADRQGIGDAITLAIREAEAAMRERCATRLDDESARRLTQAGSDWSIYQNAAAIVRSLS